ncbi:NUDIX hydrolase [Candidatus Roizmanbacteria bacterium]|nr:NUDIX hydrolase [Candidatus Roizmanbacteria bacterium]
MNKIIPVPFVLAIIRYKSKYLLTKREEVDPRDPKGFYGKWQLPGGGIDFNETAEEAVLREVKEEVGMDVKIFSLVPYIINSLRNNWQGHGIIYLCHPNKDNLRVKLNSESKSFGWFSHKEIKTLKTLPGVKEVIKTAEKIT